MKKPEAWEAIDHGEPAVVYDKSEADEYIDALEARLAEVEKELADAIDDRRALYLRMRDAEKERDSLRNSVHLASVERGIAEGRTQVLADLERLVGLVEEFLPEPVVFLSSAGEFARQEMLTFVAEYRKGQCQS